MLLTMMLGLSLTIVAQPRREKLERRTEYRPRATHPPDQLLEVARHFEIPMAIEWLEQDTEAMGPLKFENGTVLDLIRAIVERAPQQTLVVEDRIVRVYTPSAFNGKLNFLNLRLKRYCVSNESVYGANFAVRLGIDTMLYPDAFKHGVNGGYGGGEKLLWIEGINICVKNVSIRELLTEIAAQSGKAAWIAQLKPAELKGKRPFWRGVPLNEHGTSPITGHWHFVALTEDDR
jgi:hypothetical protein